MLLVSCLKASERFSFTKAGVFKQGELTFLGILILRWVATQELEGPLPFEDFGSVF